MYIHLPLPYCRFMVNVEKNTSIHGAYQFTVLGPQVTSVTIRPHEALRSQSFKAAITLSSTKFMFCLPWRGFGEFFFVCSKNLTDPWRLCQCQIRKRMGIIMFAWIL